MSEHGEDDKPLTPPEQIGLVAQVSLDPSFLELPKVINYADFEKIELRAGTILSAERVPKKDKLLKLQVEFSPPPAHMGQTDGGATVRGEVRQVIAGIGKTFDPASLVGGQYVFVTNLEPREVLKGLVSYGMILATGPSDDHLVLVKPERTAENGARFK